MTPQRAAPQRRRKIRCAIYTRKSTDEGLEQDFNSLDAQREACAAYVASQKAEGWVLVAEPFDDGGYSGGTLERPALQRLLAAIAQRQIDQIIVYKIDRLTRSLADFSKIVDQLDAVEASFVSVTQSFNTATSMGRLTLNMLLSFAQFEREVTAERIRDKIAASKRKGLWMGGSVPLGYLADGRSLKIDPDTAPTIKRLIALYREHGSIVAVTKCAKEERLCTRIITDPATGRQRGGNSLSRTHIHQILSNPIYAGRIRHHKAVYEGQHPALIPPDEWEALQAQLSTDAARARGSQNRGESAALCGKIYDERGETLTPTHTVKGKTRIRYYISRCLVSGAAKDHPDAWRLPAVKLEEEIAARIHAKLADATFIAALLPEADAATLQGAMAAASHFVEANAKDTAPTTLQLIARLDLKPARIRLRLDASQLAQILMIDPAMLDETHLAWEDTFTLKRRGVETRIILGQAGANIDPVLLRNIHQARLWYSEIIAGKTIAQLTARDGVYRGRLSRHLTLAFLAPDLLAQITTGHQPPGFTSEWLKTHDLPADWDAQRALFNAL
ncbi:recombinase family protein [Cognatiyoonia sp. IB215182]|uniref:recombinase family protein n=1 Tax=Cognatiyoonia sp. IB215182 TaxID=3097353 RepID=UPI002A1783B8|nr:recombinase family protein [Cognatiyoonia sp. IB215182]MDX8355540.1 recombinase family protein [Cognatiyoonia sp. IB215182]